MKANITSVIGEEATILVVDQVHAHIIMWGILLLSCGLEIKINFLSFFFDVRMCLCRSSLKVNVERYSPPTCFHTLYRRQVGARSRLGWPVLTLRALHPWNYIIV